MFGPTIFSTSSLIKQFLVFRVKHFQILHLKFLFAAITFTIPTSNQVAMARAGDVAVQDVRIQQTWTTIGNLSLRDPGTRRHTPAIVSSIQSTSPVPTPQPHSCCTGLRMFQLYCTNLQSNASAYIIT